MKHLFCAWGAVRASDSSRSTLSFELSAERGGIGGLWRRVRAMRDFRGRGAGENGKVGTWWREQERAMISVPVALAAGEGAWLNVLGDLYRFLVTSRDTNGPTRCWRADHSPKMDRRRTFRRGGRRRIRGTRRVPAEPPRCQADHCAAAYRSIRRPLLAACVDWPGAASLPRIPAPAPGRSGCR